MHFCRVKSKTVLDSLRSHFDVKTGQRNTGCLPGYELKKSTGTGLAAREEVEVVPVKRPMRSRTKGLLGSGNLPTTRLCPGSGALSTNTCPKQWHHQICLHCKTQSELLTMVEDGKVAQEMQEGNVAVH